MHIFVFTFLFVVFVPFCFSLEHFFFLWISPQLLLLVTLSYSGSLFYNPGDRLTALSLQILNVLFDHNNHGHPFSAVDNVGLEVLEDQNASSSISSDERCVFLHVPYLLVFVSSFFFFPVLFWYSLWTQHNYSLLSFDLYVSFFLYDMCVVLCESNSS